MNDAEARVDGETKLLTLPTSARSVADRVDVLHGLSTVGRLVHYMDWLRTFRSKEDTAKFVPLLAQSVIDANAPILATALCNTATMSTTSTSSTSTASGSAPRPQSRRRVHYATELLKPLPDQDVISQFKHHASEEWIRSASSRTTLERGDLDVAVQRCKADINLPLTLRAMYNLAAHDLARFNVDSAVSTVWVAKEFSAMNKAALADALIDLDSLLVDVLLLCAAWSSNTDLIDSQRDVGNTILSLLQPHLSSYSLDVSHGPGADSRSRAADRGGYHVEDSHANSKTRIGPFLALRFSFAAGLYQFRVGNFSSASIMLSRCKPNGSSSSSSSLSSSSSSSTSSSDLHSSSANFLSASADAMDEYNVLPNVISSSSVTILAVLVTAAIASRAVFTARILNTQFRQRMEDVTGLTQFATDFSLCRFKSALTALSDISSQLWLEPIVRPLLPQLLSAIMNNALVQYTTSFSRVHLQTLASQMCCSSASLETRLSTLIAKGTLPGRIDSAAGVLVAVNADARTVALEQSLRIGAQILARARADILTESISGFDPKHLAGKSSSSRATAAGGVPGLNRILQSINPFYVPTNTDGDMSLELEETMMNRNSSGTKDVTVHASRMALRTARNV